MKWTSDMDDQLVRLLEQKLSARKIGEIMGVSRNSVIGRAHRIGAQLQPQPGASRKKKEQRKSYFQWYTPAGKPIPPQPVLPFVDTFVPKNPVSLFDLRADSCRFPVSGETLGIMFCNEMSYDDKPYCEHHCRVAYNNFKVA